MSKKSITSSRSLKKRKKRISKIAVEKGEGLNDKQKLAVWLYVTDKDCFGSTSKAYKKAYECKTDVAATTGPRLFRLAHIIEYKNSLLDAFLNDKEIDRELMYVIKQNKDPRAKVSAIAEMNKVKGRIVEKKDITTAGKPIPLLYALRHNDSNEEDSEVEEED